MEMPSEGEELCDPILSLSWPCQSLGKATSSRESSLVPAICQRPLILNFVDKEAGRQTGSQFCILNDFSAPAALHISPHILLPVLLKGGHYSFSFNRVEN